MRSRKLYSCFANARSKAVQSLAGMYSQRTYIDCLRLIIPFCTRCTTSCLIMSKEYSTGESSVFADMILAQKLLAILGITDSKFAKPIPQTAAG